MLGVVGVSSRSEVGDLGSFGGRVGVDAAAGTSGGPEWCGRSGGPECCLKACRRREGTGGVRGVRGGAGARSSSSVSESESPKSTVTGLRMDGFWAGGVCGGGRCA